MPVEKNVLIYSHPQTDCFGVSQLFSVTRNVGCLKHTASLHIYMTGQR